MAVKSTLRRHPEPQNERHGYIRQTKYMSVTEVGGSRVHAPLHFLTGTAPGARRSPVEWAAAGADLCPVFSPFHRNWPASTQSDCLPYALASRKTLISQLAVGFGNKGFCRVRARASTTASYVQASVLREQKVRVQTGEGNRHEERSQETACPEEGEGELLTLTSGTTPPPFPITGSRGLNSFSWRFLGWHVVKHPFLSQNQSLAKTTKKFNEIMGTDEEHGV